MVFKLSKDSGHLRKPNFRDRATFRTREYLLKQRNEFHKFISKKQVDGIIWRQIRVNDDSQGWFLFSIGKQHLASSTITAVLFLFG
jgi:hypothetical protein